MKPPWNGNKPTKLLGSLPFLAIPRHSIRKLVILSIPRRFSPFHSLKKPDLWSTSHFPLLPSQLGDFIKPSSPFYRVTTCLTQGSSVKPTQPPTPISQHSLSNLPRNEVSFTSTSSLPFPPISPVVHPEVPACTSAENSHYSSISPSPPPSSPSAEVTSPELSAAEWPTLLEAMTVRPQKVPSPVFSVQANSKSRLPVRSLYDYFLPDMARDSLGATPRRSARLMNKCTGSVSCDESHFDSK